MHSSNDSATLLLVDDDPLNLDALSRRLSRQGYTVLTAPNGAEAIDVVRTRALDAVLLDVMMPGMSGIETLQTIRQFRSAADLPVIMVTANDSSAGIVEALDNGANDYVTKPVDFAVAIARVRTHLGARRADPLTGLANRALFMNRLSSCLTSSRRPGARGFAVLFMDLDRFKDVNDSLGHLAGDELLVALARRLEQSLRATDTVARMVTPHTLARLGGDEFTVLLEDVRGQEDACAVADRLLAAAARPFPIGNREVCVSLSIGVVLSDQRHQQPDELLRDADIAMYRAKALGKARCEVFDLAMLDEVNRRLEIETNLRHAVGRGELHVYYQPIVTLSSGELTGFEALLRWRRPDSIVPPSEFIPLAEETGLIVPIGEWVLRAACRQMRDWDREFPEHAGLTISVNLSPRQCTERGLVQTVSQVLAETDLAPGRLKLEITETAILDGSHEILERLKELRRLGVHLGLDDFGTGYSALSYLQRYPFDTIKIDRSFVNGIDDSGNVEIIRAIVGMANGLAMNVTAEGIETPKQLEALRALQCGHGQGYYFRHPLPSDEAGCLLRALADGERLPG